ncbi:hypothetical protein FFF34_014970 [Inquilinus sp. KBS0705]|nr:hypothetical protein FFF34_014970 [Inquilinus sp. KBS0705]
MATCLGDLFPQEFRTDYAGRALSPKSIVIINIPEFNLGYDKMMVLITTSVDNTAMACVSINTNPSPRNNHVIIPCADFDFLEYDSHMNCTNITPVNVDWLRTILTNEPERIKGEISDTQHTEILQRLSASTNIAPIIKRKFNL